MIKVTMPFSSGEDPAKTLTWAYVVALGIIAVLTIAGHMVTTYITDKQKESTEISYHISRQRTLIQQIPIYGADYYENGAKLDRDFLAQSIRDLEGSHNYLSKAIAPSGPFDSHISDELYKFYYERPFHLNEQVGNYIETAEKLANIDQYNREDIAPPALEYLKKQSAGLLMTSLDAALESYQSETLKKISHYHNIQLYAVFTILAILLLEAVFIFRPLVARMRGYHRMLLRSALEDPLTGIGNRRAFIKRAGSLIKSSVREEFPFVVVLMDLDHFKSVNDTHGHEVGDKVLQHFADVLKKSFRAGDVIGRVGGEEFAVVLARSDHQNGLFVLERFCKNVETTPCDYTLSSGLQGTLPYTVSIGAVAVESGEKQTIDDLLRQADEALYQAKENGRNQVVAVRAGDAPQPPQDGGDEPENEETATDKKADLKVVQGRRE